jgi:hypothetical protein
MKIIESIIAKLKIKMGLGENKKHKKNKYLCVFLVWHG